MLKADLGYGDGYDQKPFPFFKAFYAGGVGSVRGYEAGTLGPRDIYGNTIANPTLNLLLREIASSRVIATPPGFG